MWFLFRIVLVVSSYLAISSCRQVFSVDMKYRSTMSACILMQRRCMGQFESATQECYGIQQRKDKEIGCLDVKLLKECYQG